MKGKKDTMKEIFTQPMTDKEIKESIKLFKKYIALYCVEYEHANPLEQNRYISSCGVIEGVYFPNTDFKKLNYHSLYTICALSKVGGELGIVYSLREDNELSERARVHFSEYIFEDFTTLIYGSHFKNVKKKIENRLNEYKKDFKTLKGIKRVYKKDGGNFADVLRNFEGANIRLDFCICSSVVSSIKINYDQIYIYRKDEDKTARDLPTVEEIQKLINEKIASYEGYIEREENELKNLEKNFLRFRKICEQVKQFRASVSSWYDYKSEFDSMTI